MDFPEDGFAPARQPEWDLRAVAVGARHRIVECMVIGSIASVSSK